MSGKSTIEFTNVSEFDASVFKLNAKQNEVHVVDLLPGQSSTQETAPGETWIVKDAETGRQAGSVTGTNGYQLYEIKIGRDRGTPKSSGATG